MHSVIIKEFVAKVHAYKTAPKQENRPISPFVLTEHFVSLMK